MRMEQRCAAVCARLSHVLASTPSPHLLLRPPRGRSRSWSPAAVGPSFLQRRKAPEMPGPEQQRVPRRPRRAVPGRMSRLLPPALPAPRRRRLLPSPGQTRQGRLLRFAGVTASPSGLLHPCPDPAVRAATRSCGQQQARDRLFISEAKEPGSRRRGREKSPRLVSSLSLHGVQLTRSATDTSLYKYALSSAPAARAPKANPISPVPPGATASPPSRRDRGVRGEQDGHQPAAANRGEGTSFGSKTQNFPRLPVSKVRPVTRHSSGRERARPLPLSGREPRALGAAPALGRPLEGWRGVARHPPAG